MDLVASAKKAGCMILFNDYIERIKVLGEECRSLVIIDDDSLDRGKSLVKDARMIEGLIDDKRKQLTRPLLDEKKIIDDIAKSITSDLNDAIKDLRAQILKYEKKKEEDRLEELRRIEEEKKKAEERLMSSASSKDDVLEAIDVIQEIAKTEDELREAKSSSISKVWTYEVVDIKLVPRAYLKIDDAEVKAAIKVGIREIPGIRIFQKDQLVIR